MIRAATDSVYPSMDFNNFYNTTDSVYIVMRNREMYIAAAWISHKTGDDKIPYKFKGHEIYVMQCAFFFDDIQYSTVFDIIKTIIKDKNDRIIYAENLSRDDSPKTLINAYVNNKFKWLDDHTLYHIPNVLEGLNKEDLLKTINPDKMDDEVIDKYAKLSCNCPDIEAAQKRYMDDLKAKAASELPTTSGCTCTYYCEDEDPFYTGCNWEETTCSCCDE